MLWNCTHCGKNNDSISLCVSCYKIKDNFIKSVPVIPSNVTIMHFQEYRNNCYSQIFFLNEITPRQKFEEFDVSIKSHSFEEGFVLLKDRTRSLWYGQKNELVYKTFLSKVCSRIEWSLETNIQFIIHWNFNYIIY